MSRKVMTIVGTRPELIKLSRVIAELDKWTNHIFVHTGQNYDYELNEIFFKNLNIRRPDYFLDIAASTPAEAIANAISRTDALFEKEAPEALLVLGDTNSCLCVIAAKRRKIPIFHMEAGNRCFDLRVPEEINRKIIDHLSDINMTYTEHARRYLLAEGLRPDMVIKTGSPMKEILDYHSNSIKNSEILETLKLQNNGFFLVSIHREENIDCPQNFTNLLNTLKQISEKYSKPIIFSTHPRTRKKIDQLGSDADFGKIRFLKPLGFFDYIKLQQSASCVLSDSGTLTEESSLLNFPAVNIRNAHERPEGMDVGTVVMSGTRPTSVLDALDVVLGQARDNSASRIVPDYDVDNVSRNVVRIILSYVDFVNSVVWSK